MHAEAPRYTLLLGFSDNGAALADSIAGAGEEVVSGSRILAGAIVIVPLAAAYFALAAYRRFLREADELLRKIHFEALGVAAAARAGLTGLGLVHRQLQPAHDVPHRSQRIFCPMMLVRRLKRFGHLTRDGQRLCQRHRTECDAVCERRPARHADEARQHRGPGQRQHNGHERAGARCPEATRGFDEASIDLSYEVARALVSVGLGEHDPGDAGAD